MKIETKGFLLPLILLILITALSAQVAVDGELTRYRESSPGDVYEGSISIHNTGSKEEQVKVYIRDYFFSSDGSTSYGEPVDNERTNAKWITFFPTDIVLPPGGREEVKYTVRVPGNDELEGTYWSMLFIEDVPDKEEAEVDTTQTLSILQVIRFGIQLITDMEGETLTQLQFSNIALHSKETGRELEVHMTNVGNKWLKPELYAELYDETGQFVGRYYGEKARLFPSTSVSRVIDLSSVNNGSYRVLLIADCGDDLLFGGRYSLVIGNEN